MTYVTIEAEIADGRVVPTEGVKLPERGRALITLLPETPHRTNWDAVEATLAARLKSRPVRAPGLQKGELPGKYVGRVPSRGASSDFFNGLLGVLHRPDLDSSAWQREVRAEWDRD